MLCCRGGFAWSGNLDYSIVSWSALRSQESAGASCAISSRYGRERGDRVRLESFHNAAFVGSSLQSHDVVGRALVRLHGFRSRWPTMSFAAIRLSHCDSHDPAAADPDESLEGRCLVSRDRVAVKAYTEGVGRRRGRSERESSHRSAPRGCGGICLAGSRSTFLQKSSGAVATGAFRREEGVGFHRAVLRRSCGSCAGGPSDLTLLMPGS